MGRILITGGTGLVGSALSSFLGDDHKISILSRNREKTKSKGAYYWNPSSMEMDQVALKEHDTIIHLAGAGVGDKRWTTSRKKEILESRLDSTELLYSTLAKGNHSVSTFVTASATGVYGYDTGSVLVDEERIKPGDDFLAMVVKELEASVDRISEFGIRVVKIRIGLVLSNKGGALPKLIAPVKYGMGATLGRGDQYMSWIHLDDLCGIIGKAVTDPEMTGIYNAVAPNPVTNKEMIRAIAKQLNRPIWLPKIPGFILNLFLGEMASMVLGGNRVSSKKIESEGYNFEYNYIEDALIALL